jgi:uncharacterized protein YodC (DUF2158 family)
MLETGVLIGYVLFALTAEVGRAYDRHFCVDGGVRECRWFRAGVDERPYLRERLVPEYEEYTSSFITAEGWFGPTTRAGQSRLRVR